MTSAQRLLAAHRGEPVDRVPVWLREGFPPFGKLAEAGDFGQGWQAEPVFRELYREVAPRVDWTARWGVQGTNRWLMVPASAVESEVLEESREVRRTKSTVRTPRGEIFTVGEQRRGVDTGWRIKRLVESREDLAKLASVPFELDEAAVAASVESYRRVEEAAGERALPMAFISSPMVCVSGCMSLELFLELSLTDGEWIVELCEEILRRQMAVFERVFSPGMRTTVTIGGSEQCTPPLMAPESYDRFVVPFETRLIEFLHGMGIPVQIHCHGKVKHGLSCMLAEGADSTDPVEPPPQGDVTYEQAREIVGDRLTLVGNLEWSMLESAEPGEVREHVRRVLSGGNRRLILAASAGPISAITPRLADNYRAWVDAAEEFGG
jgi:uroporphyrinogen-III decarboxylase